MEVPAGRPGEVELHFGRDVAPGGFAWVVPVWRGDRPFARVGVMAERNAPAYFARMLERVAGRWGIARTLDGPPRQRILPLGSLARNLPGPRDRGRRRRGSGQADDGRRHLLRAAERKRSAREVLDTALGDDGLSARDLSIYQREWQRRLKGEIETQSSFRRIAQELSDVEIEGLFELARTDGVMPIVRRAAEFNRHRRLIVALLRHQPARRLFFRSFVA